ncbi:hypothetical protein O181_007966 [Austropuccinia psidii MF-1]|uniref:2'-phosphotransferase n=1 Tax=Austropuccinia psidii MF-1 TaxID=1389203 RepID=A0A9Q3GI36_9BASI|nr:hypothetical protein [Austropuccinia psidii MF-1]
MTESEASKQIEDLNNHKPSNAQPTSKKGKLRGRLNDSVDVQLSKTLSYILRHGAIKEKLQMRPDGFISLVDLLSRPTLKGFSSEDVYRVVAENEKKRFTIIEEPQPDGTCQALIRANQGHSLNVQDLQLDPVTELEKLPMVVHGTYSKFWESIARQGLKPLKRTHIHFAAGLLGEDGVISGMRASCDILIYLDVEKCLTDGIKFFRSANGVILTEGLSTSKSIPITYFKKVVKKSGEVLYPALNDITS